MYYKCIFLFLSFLLSNCSTGNSQTSLNALSNNIRETSNSIEADLKRFYKLSKSVDSLRYQKCFFESFPGSFSSFLQTYGYNEKIDQPYPLYSDYPDHLNLFCNLKSIEKERYIEKLIRIGINGHWQADGVSMMQTCMLDHLNTDMAYLVNALNKMPEDEVRTFWYFLLDGPHPDDPEKIQSYEHLVKNLRKVDPSMAQILYDEHEKLLKNSDGHGH